MKNFVGLASFLMESGADADARNDAGKTPADVADAELRDLLFGEGASAGGNTVEGATAPHPNQGATGSDKNAGGSGVSFSVKVEVAHTAIETAAATAAATTTGTPPADGGVGVAGKTHGFGTGADGGSACPEVFGRAFAQNLAARHPPTVAARTQRAALYARHVLFVWAFNALSAAVPSATAGSGLEAARLGDQVAHA